MAWSRKLFQILLPLACLAFGLRLFFVQSLFIDTDRLAPLLLPGDFVVGMKTATPNRGDVVTFHCMSRVICVGRILGLPGDRLDFNGVEVVVNQRINLERLFKPAASQQNFEAAVVSPENFFIEGDHFGEVMASEVGSILARILVSVDPAERKFRPSRIWMPIH